MPRIQPKAPFDLRLAQESASRQRAKKSLPQGRERELLSRKARQLETASQINKWLSSIGLGHQR